MLLVCIIGSEHFGLTDPINGREIDVSDVSDYD